MSAYSDPQLQVSVGINLIDVSTLSKEELNELFVYVQNNPLGLMDPYGLGPFGLVCVPAGNPGTASWIPDGVMRKACQAHDECYSTCGKSKGFCDMDFFLTTGNFAYWVAVDLFADSAYDDAQAAAGCNDCK